MRTQTNRTKPTAIGRDRAAKGADMMLARCYHRLLGIPGVCVLLLVSASCTLVEERINRTTGGPNVPADTEIQMRLESTEQPVEIAARTLPPGPLKLTITEAILLSLENNRSLMVQRLDPSIQQTFEDQERASAIFW